MTILSPTNRSPQHAQPGEDGEETWKILELKLPVDVGLVFSKLESRPFFQLLRSETEQQTIRLLR